MDGLRDFLNKLSKKGFVHVLFYIEEKGSLHYNEIQRYLVDEEKVVERASVTIIVNGLTAMGLLDRKVEIDTKPVRTTYSLSRKGQALLRHLKEIQHEKG